MRRLFSLLLSSYLRESMSAALICFVSQCFWTEMNISAPVRSLISLTLTLRNSFTRFPLPRWSFWKTTSDSDYWIHRGHMKTIKARCLCMQVLLTLCTCTGLCVHIFIFSLKVVVTVGLVVLCVFTSCLPARCLFDPAWFGSPPSSFFSFWSPSWPPPSFLSFFPLPPRIFFLESSSQSVNLKE